MSHCRVIKPLLAAGIAALLSPALVLCAGEATVTGVITDPNGDPLPVIGIQLTGPRATTGRTDKEGRFRFLLKSDQAEIEAVQLNIVTDRFEQVTRRLSPAEFQDVRITLFPVYEPDRALREGIPAPELKSVEWVGGEWKGFESARGRRVAVAFVSIKTPAGRRAIARVQEAVAAKPDALQAVLIHDAGATAAEIREYLDARQIGLPVARVTHTAYDGWYSPAFAAWRVSALPTIILIGPDGRVLQGRVASERIAEMGAAGMR